MRGRRLWQHDDVATDLLLGIGTAALLPCDAPLELDPRHPVVNPGFQLQVRIDDAGVVTSADPRVGLMHRSAEKLFESRDWRQAMALADRHDWLSAFSSEVGVALAFEAALGITPPERATWIRTLLAEANRISASLAFLSPVAGGLQPEVDMLRERLTDAQEQVTGGRVHPGFARVGGVAGPIPPAALSAYRDLRDDLDRLTPRLADAVGAATEPLAGIAVLTREDAIGFGVTGVVGRASGLELDLRRDEPYLAYGDLADLLEVVTDTAGDAPARYRVLVEQLPVSGRLMVACADELGRLGEGPVDVPLPKVVRIPEGMTYAWVDGPLGVSGCLLVGSGEKYPWRMKIRSASFATMQALPAALPGTPSALLADAVMSFPIVMGDVDR